MNPVVERFRMLLDECLGDNLEAAFIYGSVARGTATPASDIDTFVLTRTRLDANQRGSIRRLSAALQRQLGYQPDELYPVEVFSVRECEQAWRGPLVLRAIDAAARGRPIDRRTLEHDDLEILRALLDIKLLVVGSPVLDSLILLIGQQVASAATRYGSSMKEILTRMRAPSPTAEDAS